MDASVLVYKNHQNADMEGYDLQVTFHLISHYSPEKFLQLIMTSYLCQKDVLDHFHILSSILQ